MRLHYLYLIVFILFAANIFGQEEVIKKQEPVKPVLEIRSNSRAQMAVTRDNNHNRQDLRPIKMNHKLQMNKQQMKAYYKSQLQNKRGGANISKTKTSVQKRKLQKQNIQEQKLQRRKLQKQRLQRQKQQINKRVRR